jgi:hypothetical protein
MKYTTVEKRRGLNASAPKAVPSLPATIIMMMFWYQWPLEEQAVQAYALDVDSL